MQGLAVAQQVPAPRKAGRAPAAGRSLGSGLLGGPSQGLTWKGFLSGQHPEKWARASRRFVSAQRHPPALPSCSLGSLGGPFPAEMQVTVMVTVYWLLRPLSSPQ